MITDFNTATQSSLVIFLLNVKETEWYWKNNLHWFYNLLLASFSWDKDKAVHFTAVGFLTHKMAVAFGMLNSLGLKFNDLIRLLITER